MLKFIYLLTISLFMSNYLVAQYQCNDYLLLDGMEPLKSVGMDTTRNWWAISEPFAGMSRITISGKQSKTYNDISTPIFSPDGNKWAFFAEDNTTLYLVTNDTSISLGYGKPGKIVFSGNSEHFAYSYYQNNTEYIHLNDKKYEIINGVKDVFIDYYGTNLAFAIRKGYNLYAVKNYTEYGIYDEIKILGFDDNSKIVYAAKSGNGWQFYKDDKVISDIYENVSEVKANLEGTVFAALVLNLAGKYQSVLISDEYYEPLVGAPFDGAIGLALHPTLALFAYVGKRNLINYIVYNSAEYVSGEFSGKPHFSWDGEELYYISCDIDCYIGINGKKYLLNNVIDIGTNLAIAPGTNTYAYSTSSSLVVAKLDAKGLTAGMMVDKLINPRFNHFENRYETLGVINNKLYLMTCKPK